VLHVEAGLRTGNLQSPWPEEANRVLISRLAQLHATPTATTQDQLLAEGIPPERIRVTGNTIVDALLMTLPGLERHPPAIPGLTAEAILAANEGWVLITGHRRENFGSAFESICLALRELALRYPQLLWIYPVHLNPNVREPVYRILSQLPNLRLLEPLGYREFLELFRRARLILSDSGGVQEEAPTLGVPVLLMRDTTERPEAVACGTVKLVGVEPAAIVRAAQALLDHPEDDPEAFRKHAPYGSGMASELIADWILEQPHPANHKL
jgi:UDP-N-acetylglucosamine 2-epimerase (non-hydrolysing)